VKAHTRKLILRISGLAIIAVALVFVGWAAVVVVSALVNVVLLGE